MKTNSSVLVFTVTILLIMLGCGVSEDEKHLLDRIEEIWLLSEYSISDAYAQTVTLRDSISESSEKVRMNYDLLNIRLRDKLYSVPSSDDSIRQVVKYFDKYGDACEKMRAYHYMSSVYRDLHDSPKAITNGLKAIEHASTSEKVDTMLLKHIYSNMSGLYEMQLNNEESLRMALEYYRMMPEDAIAMMDLASIYYMMKDTLNALKYYNLTYDKCCKDNLFSVYPDLSAELLYVYSQMELTDKALTIYELIKDLPEELHPDNYGIAMGEYCQRYVSIDSALIYLTNDYNHSRSITVRCDAAEQIMECYYKKGDNAKAANWAMKFRDANDSVIAERQFEQTRNAQAEYRYIRNREEEARIMQHGAMQERRLYMGIILFLVLMGIGYYLHLNRRRSLERLLYVKNKRIEDLRREVLDKETDVVATKEELTRSISALDEKSAELTGTIQMLTDKQHELTIMKENLAKTQKEIAEYEDKLVEESAKNRNLRNVLDGKTKLNKELIKEYISQEMTEMNADLLELFDKSLSMRVSLSETQWRGFLANMDAKHPDFKEQINERVPRLNVVLIRTAYLMMAGLTNQQIESIMGVSRQTQWERAKKLEKYMGDVLPFRKSQ